MEPTNLFKDNSKELVEKDTLELFGDKEYWEIALDNLVTKGVNRYELEYLCTMESRLGIFNNFLNEEYVFEPPRQCGIPKPNGKIRNVYISPVKDRLIFNMYNNMLFNIYGDKLSKSCIAYTKGLSNKKILKELQSKVKDYTVYKMDINKFFDSVNKDNLNKALDEIDTGSNLDKAVREFYNTDKVVVGNSIVEHYKSLCQGCAVSSFLCNYILKDMDNLVSNLEVVYYRYSDDIILFGKDSKKALEIIDKELNRLGLKINTDKTEVFKPREPFTFLNFNLSKDYIDMGKVTVDRYRDEINNRLSRKKPLDKNINKIQKFLLRTPKGDNKKCWLIYVFGIITTEETLVELEYWTREKLRQSVTGRWNSKHNSNKVPNEMLFENGWISLIQLYREYKSNKEVFYARVAIFNEKGKWDGNYGF